MIDVLVEAQKAKTVQKRKSKSVKSGDRPIISLLKTISWRVVGTIDTITISYIITGEIKSALSIGSIEVVSKMILYYFHERIWTRAGAWRRKRKIRLKRNEIITGIGTN